MANLKEIRDRISSVKNTRKITEAMRLVAAAKVRRAQEQVLRTRPFADRLARVLESLQARMGFEVADTPLL
ncbi:F0F1 ATP synthase subunit gamma, partial [uncultured Synechococcus sp.]